MEREPKETNRLRFSFPEDIFIEILLLLPFESILACKLVSKQWKNLINDRKFSKLYHHKGSMIVLIDANKLYCVLIRHNNEIKRFPSYTVHRIPISLIKVDWMKRVEHELLSGWSNGIACVKASNGYFLFYNLFTGVLHKVKDAPLRLHSEFWIYYGFGYDRYDDDYKIMVVCDYKAGDWMMRSKGKRFDINKVQNKENSQFWVYSSRNRSWKSYNGFPAAAYSWPCCSQGGSYSFNGVLHYAIAKRIGKQVILTYDLHTRRFREILMPGGYLSYDTEKVAELDPFHKWVMKMYDVGGSWTRLLSISPSVARYLYSHQLAYTARYEWGDDRKVVLFVCGSALEWYDFRKNRKNEIVRVNVATTWQEKRREQMLEKRIQQMRKRKANSTNDDQVLLI